MARDKRGLKERYSDCQTKKRVAGERCRDAGVINFTGRILCVGVILKYEIPYSLLDISKTVRSTVLERERERKKRGRERGSTSNNLSRRFHFLTLFLDSNQERLLIWTETSTVRFQRNVRVFSSYFLKYYFRTAVRGKVTFGKSYLRKSYLPSFDATRLSSGN